VSGEEQTRHREAPERRWRVIVRWVIRGLLLCVGAALVGLTGFLLVEQWRAQGASPSLPGPPDRVPLLRVPTAKSSPTTYLGECLVEPASTKARLFLVVHSVDMEARTLTIDAFVCAQPSELARLVAFRPGHPFIGPGRKIAFALPARKLVKIRAAYRHVPVEALYDPMMLGLPPSSPPQGRTTLKALAGPEPPTAAHPMPTPSPVVSLGRVVIPIAEAPGRYPFDWYATAGLWTVAFGAQNVGLRLHDGRGRVSFGSGLAYRVAVLADPELGPFTVRCQRAACHGSWRPDQPTS
jgi:hypothetical protein